MVTVYGLQTLEKNTPFVYGNNNALMEISSAHKFGACTNVSCLLVFLGIREKVQF